MNRLTIAALASSMLVVASCATTAPGDRAPDASVTLTTDRIQYAPGDTVYVTLRNNGDRDAGYNLCEHIIQRHAGQQLWIDVEHFPPPGGVCTSELGLLPAGESVRVSFVVPLASATGSYRVTYPGSPPEASLTNEFVIGPP